MGARSGGVQLLLYSVFRIGNATNNVSWQSYQEIVDRPEVEWAVPISLGDSHRGYRVMGTTAEYFDRYRYRGGRQLEFAEGEPFDDLLMPLSAPMLPRRSIISLETTSLSPTVWHHSPPMMTTPSRSRVFLRKPVRPSTEPLSSAWRQSRQFMSIGKAAHKFSVNRRARMSCGK